MLKKKLLIFVLLNCIFLNASTIQEDILKLKTAPKQDRYKIMNMIKLKLSKMNSHQRAQMVQKLFKAMKKHKCHENMDNKMMMHQKMHFEMRKNNKAMEHMKNFNMHKNNTKQDYMKEENKHFPNQNMNEQNQKMNQKYKNSGNMKNWQGHK